MNYFDMLLAKKLVGGSPTPEPILITKSITANGEYLASSDNADGYSAVTVNVDSLPVTFLKSIKSLGNSVIVTDLVANYDWEVYIDAKFEVISSPGDYYEICGVNKSNEHFIIAPDIQNRAYYAWFGFTAAIDDSYSVYQVGTYNFANRNQIIARRGSAKCLFGDTGFTMTNRTTDDTPSTPVIICGINENGTIYPHNRSAVTIYGLQICLSGSVVHNFIPAQSKTTGRAGLYDIITNTFYPSSGDFDDFVKEV